MEEKTYKITLSDGTVIENLKLNGDNFISAVPIETTVFDNNCSPVIFNDGEADEVHENMELAQIAERNGEYWFVLLDISDDELARMKMQSDIDYIAMMSGIEL